MPNRHAKKISLSEPTSALAIPPPLSPTGFGSSLKKLKLMPPMPREVT